MELLNGAKCAMVIGALFVMSSAKAVTCDWSNPGRDPYVVDSVAEGLKDYSLPAGVRAQLADKIEHRNYDSMITITRDDPVMRDMHYGKGRVCRGAVDKSKWPADHTETALVYCVDKYCVAVPIICRNLSLIDRPVITPTPVIEGVPLPAAGPIGDAPGFAPLLPAAQEAFAGLDSPGYAGGVFASAGAILVSLQCPCRQCVGMPIAAVPEPASFAFIVLGFLLLAARRFMLR